jgi:hypothetical protein
MVRVVNKRQQKSPVITLIGEGITEQFYFRHIRSLFNFRFVIKPYYFGVTSLHEMDRKIAEVLSGGGTAVCVFDADVAGRNEAERKKLDNLFRKYGNKHQWFFVTACLLLNIGFFCISEIQTGLFVMLMKQRMNSWDS